jgi:hypothetical protein
MSSEGWQHFSFGAQVSEGETDCRSFDTCQNLSIKVEMVDLGNDPANGKIGTAVKFANAAEFHPLWWVSSVLCDHLEWLSLGTSPTYSSQCPAKG